MLYPERCKPIQVSLYNLTHSKVASNLLQHVTLRHKTTQIWNVGESKFIPCDCCYFKQHNCDVCGTCRMK